MDNNIPNGSTGGGNPADNYNPRSRIRRSFTDFHLDEFFSAANDEQVVLDEYLQLQTNYNRFITQAHSMFSLFESGLRNNMSRTLTRQEFYYTRYHQLTQQPPSPSPARAPHPHPHPHP